MVAAVGDSLVDRWLEAVLAWRQRFSLRTQDAAIGLAVAALGVIAAAVESKSGHQVRLYGYLVIVLSGLSLFWRHRFPEAVYVATLAAAALYLGVHDPRAPALLPLVVAVYTIAVSRTRRESFAVTLAGVVLLELVAKTTQSSSSFPPSALFWIAAWLLAGWLVSSGRTRREQGRDEFARRIVDAERLRIARELHDVVAHSIATINVQAGAAAHVVDRQPEQAAIALRAIKAASQEALRELRSILSVLRSIDDVGSRRPDPGIEQLDALLLTAQEAGLEVELRQDLLPMKAQLPRTLSVAAYRIVQESLTNALRYAGPAKAIVTVSSDEHELVLDITDDGYGVEKAGQQGAGLGIVGMRERAAAFGGSLEAGPRPEGGFRVHAVLPIGTP